MTIIKLENILPVLAATSSDQSALHSADAPTLSLLFHTAYATDPFANKVLQILKDGTKQYKDITLAEYEKSDNLLVY
jgi:hypothetical protein